MIVLLIILVAALCGYYIHWVNTPANMWKDLFDSKYYCETF